MRKDRAIFDFGSTNFTIFTEGKIALRRPCAVILKRSLTPSIIAYGADAVARRDDITAEELYVKPVRKGAVAHKEACILLIKSILTEVFGKFSKPPLCVLVNCGLNAEQRLEIEKVFVDAGYADIFLMESLLGLMPSMAKYGIKTGVIVGGESTEVGIFEGGKLIIGYSLDIGSDTVNERIKGFVRENFKLNISEDGAEELKKNAASLFPNDYTRVTVTGKDALTGRAKRLSVTAKELYRETAYVFGRILKVIDAALMSAPIETVREVEKTGILFAGYGSLQEGLREFSAKNLKLPVFVADANSGLPFSGAAILANDDNFLSEYMDLKKPVQDYRRA